MLWKTWKGNISWKIQELEITFHREHRQNTALIIERDSNFNCQSPWQYAIEVSY
jgi:hypothetical protein